MKTIDDVIQKLEYIMESDPRTFSNPECEYGWMFHKINEAIKMLKEIEKELPSTQPFHNITMSDVLKYIDSMPEDVWQEFTACLECRGWYLQRETAQLEQVAMIEEIRKWINSKNRGNADYFIVDKIEEIINKYE